MTGAASKPLPERTPGGQLLVAVPGTSRRPWPKATPPLQRDADEGVADDARVTPGAASGVRGARERVRERKATLRVSSG